MGTTLLERPSSAEAETRARILDAAFECAARFGLARTTMADVAKQARLARQSVYRYFPSRHELFLALVLREEEKMISTVRRAIAPHEDLRDAMEAAFSASLRAMRAHPLLDRVMATEPHELLPYLTTEANPVLELSMRIMEEIIRERAPEVPAEIAHRFAETCARVFTSYAVTPPKDDPARIASSLAELFCRGLEGAR
jgi:AcrR family transcriptional regulator